MAGLWKGRGLRSTPMRRRYLITAAVALAAAGITVGLTLATRTTPPQAAQAGGAAAAGPRPRGAHRPGGGRAAPRGRSLRRRQGRPGGAALRRATARWRPRSAPRSRTGRTASATSRRWRATMRAARSSSSRTGSRSTGAATGRAPKTAWRTGTAGAAGHALLAAGRGPAPPELPARAADLRPELPPAAGARAALPAEAARVPARARDRRARDTSCTASRWQRLGPAALGAARVRGGRPARSRRPGAAGRRRRRPFRQGRSRRAPSRASARSRSATPGARASASISGLSLLWLGSVKKAKEELTARPRRRSVDPVGDRGAPLPGASSGRRDAAETKMGRTAYGVRPSRLQHCRLLDGAPAFDGTPADG